MINLLFLAKAHPTRRSPFLFPISCCLCSLHHSEPRTNKPNWPKGTTPIQPLSTPLWHPLESTRRSPPFFVSRILRFPKTPRPPPNRRQGVGIPSSPFEFRRSRPGVQPLLAALQEGPEAGSGLRQILRKPRGRNGAAPIRFEKTQAVVKTVVDPSSVGEFTAHFWVSYFGGWIGTFTRGTIWILTRGRVVYVLKTTTSSCHLIICRKEFTASCFLVGTS